MRKYYQLFLKKREKFVLFMWCLFLAGFTVLHFYSKYNYMLCRISAAYARVGGGKKFNNGYDKRASLMELPHKHIKNANAVFLRYSQIKDRNISEIASIGFLTYYLYPTPVYYLDESSIKDCDYLISRSSLPGRNRSFLIRNGEQGKFRLIDKNRKYMLMMRNAEVEETESW